ncbi:hypothetical protein, conserved [Eimeria maxima]|uniref:proline--tRNA ligase n=1 Tax=Eimeria maxima TaxID=5804 RepID=U6M2L0_EIMMA|nr:hypothetical protein, conserved [Eimeria maxima]CDJ57308.1 hypothetical protein, conserved [Eimeria maxima]
MANASNCRSSFFPFKCLPWIKFTFLSHIVGALGHSITANYSPLTNAAVLNPLLRSAQYSFLHCIPPADEPQLLHQQDSEASVAVGCGNNVPSVAFLMNNARRLRVEPHLTVERHLRATLTSPASGAIICKRSFCGSVSAFSPPRDKGFADAEYLCGGLPRGGFASRLMMPGSVHMEFGYGTDPDDEGLSLDAEDACVGELTSNTASEPQHSSAPLDIEGRSESPSVSEARTSRSIAATLSGQILEKARLVQATSSGLFCILPLGFRVLKKIETVCHQELAGTASPLSLPNIMPMQWLENSERIRSFGQSLYKVQDRRSRQFFLPPTSEEAAAWLAASGVRSHRELPQVFYQIGPKFRDEARPRAGCLRSREFIMLEAYSFHQDAVCRESSYRKMDECFRRILTRVGAGPVYRFQADPGTMGGPCSHEYHVSSILGSDRIVSGVGPLNESKKDASAEDMEYHQNSSTLEPAARWNDGRRVARLGQAVFRLLQKTAAEAGGPADILFDDRQGLTLRQMQSHADLVGIPHQLIIKDDLLRTPGNARVLCISRKTGRGDILPIRAALNRLRIAFYSAAVPFKE